MTLPVHIKHAGKVYDVDLNTDLPASAFKDAIYQVTGVPPERMKVMIKGGVLKDDTDWKKVAPKSGQTFMVIGAAGELPKPPEQPVVFLEDMDDTELAEALAKPVGLRNLGNTCYMNASIQAFRAIPELQVALNAKKPTDVLSLALHELYNGMGRTTSAVIPLEFLQVLRQVNPQFAEPTRGSQPWQGLYAQQDAEECYGQIVNSLRSVPGLPASPTTEASSSEGQGAASERPIKKFIEQYMMGEMRRELKCDEAPDESTTITTENVLKVDCNIGKNTNYMFTGIMSSLDQKVEKNSPSLGRQAIYSQRSRLTRLPAYLTVHMVRFEWRADINKKTKIMRKVKFPVELDALDLATDELKAKLLPASRRLKEIEKERAERRKVRKRTKVNPAALSGAGKQDNRIRDVEMRDVADATSSSTPGAEVTTAASTGGDVETGDKADVPAGELADEAVYRDKEMAELTKLVDLDVQGDIGCSVTGLYELVAIVTHKGAAADGGHYIGFVKKSVFHATKPTNTSAPAGPEAGSSSSAGAAQGTLDENDEDWYKFDDDSVSVFPAEKLATLEGGGEDSSAYVLLYKTKSLS